MLDLWNKVEHRLAGQTVALYVNNFGSPHPPRLGEIAAEVFAEVRGWRRRRQQ